MGIFKILKKSEKQQIHTIRFYKYMEVIDRRTYKLVSDSFIMETIDKLKEKYGFTIVSVILGDEIRMSEISLKCSQADRDAIFIEFCKLMSYKITGVRLDK